MSAQDISLEHHPLSKWYWRLNVRKLRIDLTDDELAAVVTLGLNERDRVNGTTTPEEPA